MAQLRRFLGILLLLIAPVVIYALVNGAITYIDPSGKKDINNPVIWVIIIGIFLPIAVGLMIFGWYAFRGEYDTLPENNTDLKD